MMTNKINEKSIGWGFHNRKGFNGNHMKWGPFEILAKGGAPYYN